MTNMVWKCEQWFGGKMQAQQVFDSENEARQFAKRLSGVAPELVCKIEAMPINQVWN